MGLDKNIFILQFIGYELKILCKIIDLFLKKFNILINLNKFLRD
jgi:hypothetical protein